VLEPFMTVIADDRQVHDIGGIMGGEDSGVSETTTDVMLEVAYFTPERIARTGQALALTIHNDVIVPANPSFEVRMFAIAALAAEFAAMLSETPDAAGDMIDAIAEAEQAVLRPKVAGAAMSGDKNHDGSPIYCCQRAL